MKKFTIILVLLIVGVFSKAQVVNTATADTLSGEHIGKLTIAGYIDAYFGYCLNPSGKSVPFFVSSAKHHEITVNLAYIDLRYQNKNFRARIMPGFGSYMNANYALEPVGLNSLVEGHAGFRIFPKKEIWLDAGILGSPYTNESAISKDHLMYTRSLAPEYVPYYLGGAKLTLPLGKKANLYLYALNGWQQINDLNMQKSLGTQLEMTLNDKNLLNWNTYIGNERSEYTPTYRTRYFSDVYWIHTAGKISITSCAFFGMQEVESNEVYSIQNWWQANFIARYKFNDKFSLSGRVEYFSDVDNTVMPSLNSAAGFECFSSGICFNYHFSDHGMFRLDARNFLTKELMFRTKNNDHTNYMNWVTANITVWF